MKTVCENGNNSHVVLLEAEGMLLFMEVNGLGLSFRIFWKGKFWCFLWFGVWQMVWMWQRLKAQEIDFESSKALVIIKAIDFTASYDYWDRNLFEKFL